MFYFSTKVGKKRPKSFMKSFAAMSIKNHYLFADLKQMNRS